MRLWNIFKRKKIKVPEEILYSDGKRWIKFVRVRK